MSILRTLWDKIAGDSAWLLLLLVAAGGAYLYADGARAKAERDRIAGAAAVVCAGAGVEFAASVQRATDAAGRPVTIPRPAGELCQRKVGDLARFKAETDQQSAQLLAEAMRDHASRQNTDTAAARRAAQAAADATARMETADAEARRTNRVGVDWYAAVNGVAGLRAPE